jgi:branched-chain amino acid transport system ATP-binding protein
MLRLEAVHAGYGSLEVLHGVDLHAEEGEIVALIGANGAGKTTVLKAICGVVRVGRGAVRFRQKDITNRPTKDIVRMGISQVPEGRRLFGDLTVQENLELGAYLRRDREAVRRDIEHVLSLFPRLAERLAQLAGSLSGGEQQMCAIGRALMARPRLLLLDEPSLGLAPLLVEQIFEIVRRLHADGTSILLVEQNAKMALQVAHRGYVMETGEIAMSGPAKQLLDDPRVRSAYLGGV